jgi:hypothetical protein
MIKNLYIGRFNRDCLLRVLMIITLRLKVIVIKIKLPLFIH